MTRYNNEFDYRPAAIVIIILLVTLLIMHSSGCAVLTEEESELRLQLDRENWALCEYAYELGGVATLHIDHIHRNGHVYGMPEHHAIVSDLMYNNCRLVLGKYWAELD